MRVSIALAAAVSLTASAAFAACDPGEREFRFSHTGPAFGSARAEAANTLADRINFDLNGRACMTVTAEAEDHTDATLLAALAEGRFDFGAAETGTLGAVSPRYLIYDLPFLFDGIEAVLHFNDSGTGRQLLSAAAGEEVTGLALWLDGFEQITANRPVEAPGDMEGLIFAATGSAVESAYFETLGAGYVELDRQEVIDALRDGVLDGQNSSFATILSDRLQTVQEAATQTDHSVAHLVLFAGSETWEGLEPALRADLAQIVREVTHERNRLVFELNEAAKYQLSAKGMAVRELTEAERLAWKRAMQPVWFGFGGEIGFDQISTAIYANTVTAR